MTIVVDKRCSFININNGDYITVYSAELIIFNTNYY